MKDSWTTTRKDLQSFVCVKGDLAPVCYVYPPDNFIRIGFFGKRVRIKAERLAAKLNKLSMGQKNALHRIDAPD